MSNELYFNIWETIYGGSAPSSNQEMYDKVDEYLYGSRRDADDEDEGQSVGSDFSYATKSDHAGDDDRDRDRNPGHAAYLAQREANAERRLKRNQYNQWELIVFCAILSRTALPARGSLDSHDCFRVIHALKINISGVFRVGHLPDGQLSTQQRQIQHTLVQDQIHYVRDVPRAVTTCRGALPFAAFLIERRRAGHRGRRAPFLAEAVVYFRRLPPAQRAASKSYMSPEGPYVTVAEYNRRQAVSQAAKLNTIGVAKKVNPTSLPKPEAPRKITLRGPAWADMEDSDDEIVSAAGVIPSKQLQHGVPPPELTPMTAASYQIMRQRRIQQPSHSASRSSQLNGSHGEVTESDDVNDAADLGRRVLIALQIAQLFASPEGYAPIVAISCSTPLVDEYIVMFSNFHMTVHVITQISGANGEHTGSDDVHDQIGGISCQTMNFFVRLITAYFLLPIICVASIIVIILGTYILNALLHPLRGVLEQLRINRVFAACAICTVACGCAVQHFYSCINLFRCVSNLNGANGEHTMGDDVDCKKVGLCAACSIVSLLSFAMTFSHEVELYAQPVVTCPYNVTCPILQLNGANGEVTMFDDTSTHDRAYRARAKQRYISYSRTPVTPGSRSDRRAANRAARPNNDAVAAQIDIAHRASAAANARNIAAGLRLSNSNTPPAFAGHTSQSSTDSSGGDSDSNSDTETDTPELVDYQVTEGVVYGAPLDDNVRLFFVDIINWALQGWWPSAARLLLYLLTILFPPVLIGWQLVPATTSPDTREWLNYYGLTHQRSVLYSGHYLELLTRKLLQAQPTQHLPDNCMFLLSQGSATCRVDVANIQLANNTIAFFINIVQQRQYYMRLVSAPKTAKMRLLNASTHS